MSKKNNKKMTELSEEKSNKRGYLIIGIIILIIIILLLKSCNAGNVYTITLENITNTYTIKTNREGFIKEPEKPIKDGYIFDGWYYNNEKIKFPMKFENDATIEANWIKKEQEEDKKNDIIIEEPATDSMPSNKEEKDEQKEENKKPVVKPNNKPTTIKVTSIKLSPSKTELNVGKNVVLKATISPNNSANKKITWKSSNTKVATIDKNGNVVAISPGTVKITASIDGKSATCTIIVKKELTYELEYKIVEGTSISQYKIYIKNSDNKYVNGIVRITTTSGKTFEEKITQNGSENMYIKSTIEKAEILKIS